MFGTSKNQAPLVRNAPPAAETKPKGSRPELLAMLPKNSMTSPGVIAGIFAFQLLYGLLLAAVMSTMEPTKREIEVWMDAPPQVALNITQLDEAVTKNNAVDAQTKERLDKDKAKHDEEKAKAEAAAAEQEKKRKQAEEERKANELKDKLEKERIARQKKREADRKIRAMSIEELVKNAQNQNARPADVQVKAEKTIGPLGPLIDPGMDCAGFPEKNALTILVPNTLHTLSTELKVANSPRALTKVSGDFIAEVTIAGVINPGTQTIKNLPFAYQGAGLLVWLDVDNYVRLERGVIFVEGGGRKPEILVENCKDGKRGKPYDKVLNFDTAIRLRIERKSKTNEIVCSFNSDIENDFPDNNWVKTKQFPFVLPTTVSIGISASNVSLKGYQARFEDFSLNKVQPNPAPVRAANLGPARGPSRLPGLAD